MNDACDTNSGWQRVVENGFTLFVAALVSIIVLMIFASDRLDGDEVWKGALVGPAVVGSCKFFQSGYAQSLFGERIKRLFGG